MSRIVQMEIVADSAFIGDEIKSPSSGPFVKAESNFSEAPFKFVSTKSNETLLFPYLCNYL